MFRDLLPLSFELGWPQVVLVAIISCFLLVAMFIAVRAGYRLSLGLIGFKFEPMSKLAMEPFALDSVTPKANRKLLAKHRSRSSENADTHLD